MSNEMSDVRNKMQGISEPKHTRAEREINQSRQITGRGRVAVIDLSGTSQSAVAAQKAFASLKASWESMVIPSAIREMQKIADQYKTLWAKSDLRSSFDAMHSQIDFVKAHLETLTILPIEHDIQRISNQYKNLWDSSILKQSMLEIQKTFESTRITLESPATTQIVHDVQKMAEGYRNFLESSAYPRLFDIVRDIADTINISAYARRVDFSHINIANIVKEYDNIREAPFVINRGGTISSQTMTLNVEDIFLVLDESVQRHMDAKVGSIEELINSLIVKIDGLKEPLLKRIFIGVIIGLITALLLSFVKPQIQEAITNFSLNRRVIIKEIQKETRTNVKIDAALLNNFRFVSVKRLTMRANRNRKSAVVNMLYFGTIVRIVEKRKNWYCVEYVNSETNKALQGWVFTRYLEKLR